MRLALGGGYFFHQPFRLTWRPEASDGARSMDESAYTSGATGKPESAYAWVRLAASLLLGAVGSVGFWAVVVTLPAVQAEFHAARADASLPYTLAMSGFGLGGVIIGRLVDRFGIFLPTVGAILTLGLAFIASAAAPGLTVFALSNLVIGVGCSATFAPLVADISHWFTRRLGIAVGICATGNYLGGAIWPPVVQGLVSGNIWPAALQGPIVATGWPTAGWRQAQVVIGIACIATMLPLALVMRRRVAARETGAAGATVGDANASLGLHPYILFALLCVAGVACCVAMAMPQVHIVAYCGDLGYGVARGAEMLSLMLGFGIVSRVASGFVADRIGAVATLLTGSVLQGVALFLYLLFDGLDSLYVISALFGLFQGGIVPMYAVIVREYFPPKMAGTLVGLVIMATIAGMALGGWMSGAIFDFTGSYSLAFANGLAWNLLNGAIALFLLGRRMRPAPTAIGSS
jgi:MFS family permease